MTLEKGTYASFELSLRSVERLHRWGSSAGIKNLYNPEEYHITICYSKLAVDYKALGPLPPLPVKPLGFNLFGKNKEYLVLEVRSSFASNRNDYAKLIGAISDFDEYKPHISLAKDHGMKSTDRLPPIDFMLYLNKEVVKPLDPDWESKKKAKQNSSAVKRLEAYLVQVGNFTRQ